MIKTTNLIFNEYILKIKNKFKFLCIWKNGHNKFLALLSRTEKFLGGSTRSLAYIDHIIQFGLDKFLAMLLGNR